MKNVEVSFQGEKMLVTVDCAKTFGPSKSGKTTIIATTEGNAEIVTPEGKKIVLGMNVYTKG